MTPPLASLQLRLCRKCNLTCTHCYTSSSPQSDEPHLPLDRAIEILEQARPLGLQVVTLIGGEPLIYPHFAELLDWFDEHPDIAIELETNGVLLHRHAERLSTLRNEFAVGISIDGVALRGEHATKLALGALAIPIGRGSKYVQTLCCYDNLDVDFLSICEQVALHGIDHVIFPGPSGCGRGKDHDYLSWEDCKRMIDAVHAKGWTNIRVELPALITKQCNFGCGWNTIRCEVMPNGDVTSCAQAYYEDPALSFGNVFEQPLETIWRDSTRLNRLRSVRQEDMKGACRTCDHWEGCFGSCRSWARSWDDERSWTAPYLRCDEFLADPSIGENFHAPFKEVNLLKFRWADGQHVVR